MNFHQTVFDLGEAFSVWNNGIYFHVVVERRAMVFLIFILSLGLNG